MSPTLPAHLRKIAGPLFDTASTSMLLQSGYRVMDFPNGHPMTTRARVLLADPTGRTGYMHDECKDRGFAYRGREIIVIPTSSGVTVAISE